MTPEERAKAVRTIRVEGDLAYVPLTRGYEAVIDAADVPLVEGRNWYAKQRTHTVYACRSQWSGGADVTVRMHRVIAAAPDGMDVDHIDGDGLNNRRSNLRHATRSENNCNRRAALKNASGLKGVSWNKANKKWLAQIRFHKQKKHLGYFNTPEEAHAAYCAAANVLHGEYARP